MNLCQLVDQTAVGTPSIADKKNRIVNEINPYLSVCAESKMLGLVIQNLLDEAIHYSMSKSVRIRAKSFHNVILVQIKYKDLRSEAVIENSLDKVKMQAEKLGGCLYVKCSKINGTTIAFTFLSQEISSGMNTSHTGEPVFA